jgi:hypothetical protein
VTARSEPLLWLQLIGLGAIPLELLLVLLLLAGSDPGPFPGLEQVLTWALGAIAPSVLLWRMPPDPFSLLLICTPVRLRTPGQLGFSQQPMGLPLKILLASGTALLLPLLWWLDTTSVLATSYALLPTPNRLAALVAVAPLLTLMVWQWQQLAQAIVLLGRNPQPTAPPPGAGSPSATPPHQPLCLGLPWLRLPALAQTTTPELLQELEGPKEALGEGTTASPVDDQPEGPPNDQVESLPTQWFEALEETVSDPGVMDEGSPEDPEPEDPSAEPPSTATEDQDSVELAPEAPEAPGVDRLVSPDKKQPEDPEITDVEFTPLESAAVAVEPEEAAEEAEGTDLDPQIG